MTLSATPEGSAFDSSRNNDAAATPLRILVIDDDRFTRVLLREMFLGVGATHVREAGDGHQALRLMDNEPWMPELILCDLQMPGMDGIEFLRELAARRFTGDLCLFSGTPRPVLEAAQRLAGAHLLRVIGILEKPVSEAALMQVLSKARHAGAEEPTEPSAPHPASKELTADELREGIANDRIELMFQPKVAVRGRRMAGAECLARFRHPTRGLLGPASFVPLAEQHHLIDALTVDVLRQAAQHLSSWYDSERDFKLSVNVSMLNLHALDLPETFERIVRKAGMQPSDFMLEITESALPSDYVVGLDILLRLRLKGFQLSLDDFGTGFSTMRSLSQMPFCELKLDQQFVQGAVNDAKAMTILESSVQLGHALNLNLVAEGVETPSEWALVEHLGCDEVQGYHVARPMPAAALRSWVHRWERSDVL
ncbi:MAG: EAL domain-containing response regulator [Burkholderiales bacterium]